MLATKSDETYAGRMTENNTEQPTKYLSKKQISLIMGAKSPSLSGYKLPTPDVVIGGEMRPDGTVPIGVVLGWREDRIHEWWAVQRKTSLRPDFEKDRIAELEAEIKALRAKKRANKRPKAR